MKGPVCKEWAALTDEGKYLTGDILPRNVLGLDARLLLEVTHQVTHQQLFGLHTIVKVGSVRHRKNGVSQTS